MVACDKSSFLNDGFVARDNKITWVHSKHEDL